MDSLKEYLSSVDAQRTIDSIFDFLSNDYMRPITDFIFKWSILGPMLVVDNVVIPITNVIGWQGLTIGLLGILGLIVTRRFAKDKPVVHIEEPIEELQLVPLESSHPRYGKN